MSDSELAPKIVNAEVVPSSESTKRELTPANRVFLQLLGQGIPTLEAYRQAGYEGTDHAAYQMRHELKEELLRMLEGQGIDRAGLMLQLGELLRMPIAESEITRGVSVKQKLSMLSLLAKIVPQPKTEADQPKYTAFVVNQTFKTAAPEEPKA